MECCLDPNGYQILHAQAPYVKWCSICIHDLQAHPPYSLLNHLWITYNT